MRDNNDFDNELPKRGDDIYREIEAFEDFELRFCIAYEMAIRNKEVIALIKKAISLLIEKDIPHNNASRMYPIPLPHSGQYFKQLRDKFYFPQELYLDYPFLSEEFSKLNEIIEKGDGAYRIIEEIAYENRERPLEDEIDSLLKASQDSQLPKLFSFENKPYSWRGDYEENGTKYYRYERRTPIFKEALHYTDNEEEEVMTEAAIKPNYSRPKLQSLHSSTIRNFMLDLSTPTEELLDFVKKVSDDFKEFKTPIMNINELLGEKLEKCHLVVPKKKLADKFFVYDYVTARLKQIDKGNQDAKDTFEQEKEEINSNTSFDANYKKYLINEARGEFEGHLIHTSIKDILSDEKFISQIPTGTAKRYYYEIKPYIEDMKYVELITGVRQKTS